MTAEIALRTELAHPHLPSPGAALLRILLVEDNPGDARLLELALQETGAGRFAISRAHSLEEGLKALRHGSFDVALADLGLPDSHGVSTVMRILQESPLLPVVVMTGLDDPDLALEALHAGAQDYLVKGENAPELVYRAIAYAIERKRLDNDLIAAKAEAEAANREKSTFLATMSHELRTPMNAILGFAEVMKDQMFGPIENAKYLEYAKDIHTSGRHLLELINDILDLSKIEAGRFQVVDDRLKISEEISACLRMIEGRASRNGIKINAAVADKLPLLRADRTALRQVLLNLLSNAVKFTPKGGQITLDAQLNPQGGLTLSVTDTGIGIPESALTKVFEPFSRGNVEVARHYEGTGLGLPISRRFMELHQGELLLESKVNQGTTARAIFPPERILN